MSFLCLAGAVGRARCHISGIFQLCLGCCSRSACGHEPSLPRAPAVVCAQAELASGAKYLCFGRGVCDKPGKWQDHSDRAIIAPNREYRTEDHEMDPASSPRKEGAVGAASWPWVPSGYRGCRGCIGEAPALWQGLCPGGRDDFPVELSWGSCGSCAEFCILLTLGTRDLPLSLAWNCSAGSQQPLLSETSFCRNRFHEENAMHTFNLPLSPLTSIQ